MKWPRQYAMDYLNAKTEAEKQKVFNSCPDEWKGLVKDHIRLIRDRQKPKEGYK